MKRGENIVIQNARLTSENVRLTNKVSVQEDYIYSLEEDVSRLREEILELQKERQALLQANEELSYRCVIFRTCTQLPLRSTRLRKSFWSILQRSVEHVSI